MLDLFYILIGGLAAIFILTIIICLIFRRRLIWERPLDPRRDQLSIVQKSSYYKRRLLNGEEYRLFQFLEDWMKGQKTSHRLFAQVSLGEILGSDDDLAYACINSKRCDFLIIDGRGYPVLAIEYQGTGHYSPTSDERDYVKQKALEKAGISLIEVSDGFIWPNVRSKLEQTIALRSITVA